MEQPNRVEVSSDDLRQAFADNLAWQDTRISLRARAMKRVKRRPFRLRNGRIGWDVVGRSPLSRTPESFVFTPDFFSAPLAQRVCVAEFRIEDILQFPTVKNERI